MIVFLCVGGVSEGFDFSLLVKMSFGNMGFAGMYCAKNEVSWTDTEYTTLNFNCEHTTAITGVFSSGLITFSD